MQLVTLVEAGVDADFDLRYATNRNILERKISDETTPRLIPAAASALAQAADLLQEQGYRLVVWDAYRSPEVQKVLLGKVTDERYVLLDSNHCKGRAVDVTLADGVSGDLLDMGTDHDDFTEKAHADAPDLSPQAQQHRQLLVDVMEQCGFTQWPYEWWHFDYN